MPQLHPQDEPEEDVPAFLTVEEPPDPRTFRDRGSWLLWSEFLDMMRRYEQE